MRTRDIDEISESIPTMTQEHFVDSTTRLLHECENAAEFSKSFKAATDYEIEHVIDEVVARSAPKAVFLTGSLPLGMATSGSDVDFMVLVDSKDALLGLRGLRIANTDRRMAFTNDNDLLRAGLVISVLNGITVEVAVIITPRINHIYSRLRSRGPELSESEIMALSRLSTGWLLSQSENYLGRNSVTLNDPALGIYCSTKNFTFSLIYRHKALAALDLSDTTQALHLGRMSVEMAYLSYFASEGFSYLGPKWLAQLGHGRGASERVRRHTLLKESIHLLFPAFGSSSLEAALYLKAVTQFLISMRNLIEQKTLFRIAFGACPQIYSVA